MPLGFYCLCRETNLQNAIKKSLEHTEQKVEQRIIKKIHI
jgi:hypothetical protein